MKGDLFKEGFKWKEYETELSIELRRILHELNGIFNMRQYSVSEYCYQSQFECIAEQLQEIEKEVDSVLMKKNTEDLVEMAANFTKEIRIAALFKEGIELLWRMGIRKRWNVRAEYKDASICCDTPWLKVLLEEVLEWVYYRIADQSNVITVLYARQTETKNQLAVQFRYSDRNTAVEADYRRMNLQYQRIHHMLQWGNGTIERIKENQIDIVLACNCVKSCYDFDMAREVFISMREKKICISPKELCEKYIALKGYKILLIEEHPDWILAELLKIAGVILLKERNMKSGIRRLWSEKEVSCICWRVTGKREWKRDSKDLYSWLVEEQKKIPVIIIGYCEEIGKKTEWKRVIRCDYIMIFREIDRLADSSKMLDKK